MQELATRSTQEYAIFVSLRSAFREDLQLTRSDIVAHPHTIRRHMRGGEMRAQAIQIAPRFQDGDDISAGRDLSRMDGVINVDDRLIADATVFGQGLGDHALELSQEGGAGARVKRSSGDNVDHDRMVSALGEVPSVLFL